MNRVTIDLEKLQQNIETINQWMEGHNSSWTLVTKVLCGHHDTIRALMSIGVRSMGDSRLENLEVIEGIEPDFEAWYLRLPHISAIKEIVSRADVSLNSEIEIIEAINAEAARQGKTHRIIIMIELGDLREGILPGTLVEFYKQVFRLPNIEVLGIGANLGCLSGAVPSIDQMMQLVLYKELLELKFERSLPMISAGSSSLLPMLHDGKVPPGINHFRIGESVFLGSDLISGGCIPGLRDDAVILEAEIVEIKEKSLIPVVETSETLSTFESFEDSSEPSPGARGYRALVSVGQLDTEVTGLSPVNPKHRLAGASSDLTVVNLGEDDGGLSIGDTIRFRVNYGALLRLMNSKYIEKVVIPEIDSFSSDMQKDAMVEVPPVMDSIESNGLPADAAPTTAD